MKIEPFKMQVTPEQSKAVQGTIIANGYTWFDGSTEVELTDKPHLYFDAMPGQKPTLAWFDDRDFFLKDKDPEITFEEFAKKYITNGT